MNREKCAFAKKWIKFLGHIIEKVNICMDMGNMKAIQEWKDLANVKELRSFLKLTNYYCHFVKGYWKKASSLIELLNDVPWEWSNECLGATDDLNEAMMSDLVLTFPNVMKSFEVQIDALDFVLGGVFFLGNIIHLWSW